LPVVADGDHELAICRPEQLVWGDAGVCVAEALRRLAGDKGSGGLVGERGEEAAQQIHPYVLAWPARLTTAQREQDPGERILPAEHIDERDADLARCAVRRTGD